MKRKHLIFLTFSLVAHAIVLSLPASLSSKLNLQVRKNDVKESNNNNRTIKFKKVGSKNGSSDNQLVLKKKQSKGKNLNLDSLAFNPNTGKSPIQILKEQGPALRIFKDDLKQYVNTNPGSAGSILERTSDLEIKMIPPKGVSLDKLNSIELKLFSFYQRTGKQYINTIFSKINESHKKRPNHKFPFTRKSQNLSAKVVYDKDGNIIRIKMLDLSKSAKLQDLFLNVLQSMDTIPNPPKLLVQKNETFEVVYAIKITL